MQKFGQRSVGSKDREYTNGRTEAIALPPSLMRSVITYMYRGCSIVRRFCTPKVRVRGVSFRVKVVRLRLAFGYRVRVIES